MYSWYVQVVESVPSPSNGNDNLGKLSQCSFFLISALILVLQKAVIYIGSNNYALVIRWLQRK